MSRGPTAASLPAVAALSAVAGLIVLQSWSWLLAGQFEYPLDDVYIHLSMAEGIAAGTYGINPGEPASAASSVLYPLLLVPFAGSEWQRALPALWNLAGVAVLGGLFGAVVRASGLSGRAALAIAALGPLALGMPGTAFSGMEHTLHAVTALATLLGLWRALNGGGIAWWFAAAVICGPLLRFEGLGLSLLAAGAIGLAGHRRAAVVLAVATLLPVAGFMVFLVSQGLAPLPSSVLVKSAAAGEGMFATLALNLTRSQGIFLSVLVALTLLMVVTRPELRRPPRLQLAAVLLLAGAAHLLFGHFGWLFRYEHYIFVLLLSGLLLLRTPGPAGRLPVTVAVAGAAGFLAIMAPYLVTDFPAAPRALLRQQVQMARLARMLGTPVAANDIGRLSWGAGAPPILDLWGLADAGARMARLAPGGAAPGWADALVQARGARTAMIYADWFEGALAPDWVPVALLTQDGERGALAGYAVTILATDPAAEPGLRAAVAAWAADLPDGAHVTELP